MLSMLRFCRAIKYHSVWHVDTVRRLGPGTTSRSLEHVLVSAGGKFAWPISAEVKEVDCPREGQTKMGDSIRMSFSFFCLYYAKSKLSATAARRNKSFSLSELESVIIRDTILFIRTKQNRSVGF